MIDSKLLELGEQLRKALTEQADQARKSLEDLPEGQQKTKLKGLLRQASAGKLSVEEAQKELKTILSNAD
jgi:hypothetical protein